MQQFWVFNAPSRVKCALSANKLNSGHMLPTSMHAKKKLKGKTSVVEYLGDGIIECYGSCRDASVRCNKKP